MEIVRIYIILLISVVIGIIFVGKINENESLTTTKIAPLTAEKSNSTFPWNVVYDPDNWQRVIRDKSYVYSAHLDPQSKGNVSTIRIIGTLETSAFEHKNELELYCNVWIKKGDRKINTIVKYIKPIGGQRK